MNNRFWNSKNPNQGNFKKVLCVCSAGLLRSPTVAWILSNPPFNFNTRAVGASPSFALTPIDDVFIEWADVIVFVSDGNEAEVSARFDISEKHVVTLNLPDVFQFRDPRLVEIATEQLTQAFKELDEEQQKLDKEAGLV
ncbi:MAG: hypothetical protein EBS98_10375 [Chitinophagia bacterium]|jgi:predicted protein tyrosine phosphatase|nr:hypothetical protein [Chitinophagia bacterium]